MATARMRRTFKYPEDDADETEPGEGIDEEEQEKLIQSIATQDAASSALYRKFFLAIPILGLLNYLRLVGLLIVSGNNISFFVAFYFVAVLSLLFSFWMIFDIPSLNTWNFDSFQTHRFKELRSKRIEETLAWTRSHVSAINAAICIVVVVFGLIEGNSGSYHPMGGGKWSILPPICTFLMSYIARRELQPVDVKGLQRLRYEYKGA